MSGNGIRTILAVDDDPVMLCALESILEKSGFSVKTASSGKEAIAVFDSGKEKVDVILSDIYMAEIDGVALAKANYEKHNLPFIAMTGIKNFTYIGDLLIFGVQDFLLKPFDNAHLVKMVNNAIARHEMIAVSEGPVLDYPGNIGRRVIGSKMKEIAAAVEWLKAAIKAAMTEKMAERFANFASEFIINSHEHGNLGITEAQKSEYMESGEYLEELIRREGKSGKSITLDLTLLDGEIALCVADEGPGFNFRKYLEMPESVIRERLMMPNGRGIQISAQYFDNVVYSNGGSMVTLRKKAVLPN